MKIKYLLIICLFCLSSMFFSCDLLPENSTQSKTKLKYGTYSYTLDDGTTSTIVLNKDKVCITNGDYSVCPHVYCMEKFIVENTKLAAEGLILTQEDQNKIMDDSKSIDFSIYDGQELDYISSPPSEGWISIDVLDSNGEEIYGLGCTYYSSDDTIGFGDIYYQLI